MDYCQVYKKSEKNTFEISSAKQHPLIPTQRPGQNSRPFPDDIFNDIYTPKISALWLKFYWNISSMFQCVVRW